MNRRKRKPLDDALASDFVYGQDESKTEPIEEEIKQPPAPPKPEKSASSTTAKPNKESSLMDKLQVQPKEATKRFTVDLPESMHRKLSILSAKTGRTKADIIRMVLDDVLADVEELGEQFFVLGC